MSVVLALDLATNAGFCGMREGAVVEVGSWDLSEAIPGNVQATPAGHGMKCLRLYRELLALASRLGPIAVVAVEDDFGRGSGSVLLSRLQGIAHLVAMEIGTVPIAITLDDWREDIHGVSGENTETYKQLALDVCAQDGVDVPDADAAEAYCIARFVSDRAVFSHRQAGRRRAA